MILHFYFARRFLRSFALLSLALCTLAVLIDLIEQIRILSGTPAGFGDAFEMSLLHLPQTIYDILPLIAILATVAMYVSLARSSELIVVRAAGRSALLSLLAPMAAMLTVGLFALAVFNPIVAATTKQYAAMSERYRTGATSALSISPDGLWLRQGGPEGQTVIRAGRANAEGTELYGASFFTYAPKGGLTGRIEAETATLVPGAWLLRGVKLWPLAGDGNPEAEAETRAMLRVPSSLTLDRIRDSFGQPSAVAIWDLPAYARALEEAGFTARRHLVWFQSELARPFFLTAMVMIAAAFSMRHARSGRTGVAVLTAVLIGFGLHYVKNLAQILGENGQIPTLMAAWAPPAASLMLALGLILHQEDG